jgi:hypothetical protein
MMILNIMVVLVCLIAVLSFTVIAPVIYVISALIALISALVHVKEPEAAGAKVSKQLTKLIKIPLLLMLFQCVLPTMTYSSGALTLLILSLVCVVFNLVLSRLQFQKRIDTIQILGSFNIKHQYSIVVTSAEMSKRKLCICIPDRQFLHGLACYANCGILIVLACFFSGEKHTVTRLVSNNLLNGSSDSFHM